MFKETEDRRKEEKKNHSHYYLMQGQVKKSGMEKPEWIWVRACEHFSDHIVERNLLVFVFTGAI